MSTAFNRLLGATQGRIKPTAFTATLDDYVFLLGSDLPGVFVKMKLSDQVVLEQTADVTGIKLIRFRAKIRPPVIYPTTGIGLGVALPPPTSPYVAVTCKWTFAWGTDATPYSTWRILEAGRTLDLRDGAIDVSQLSGNHAIQFRLKLENL